jgi:hypothetical protein
MALASADIITLDPPAVADGRTPLELTGAIEITEADYGNAEVEQFLSARRYGEIPVGYRIPNRTVEYALRIQASGTVGIGDAVRDLQRKVARFQAEGGWLGRTLEPRTAGEFGEDVLYADVVDAALSLPADWIAQRQEVLLDARLSLTVLPDFYGTEVAESAADSADPHDSIVLTGTIGGDYPARSRYTITDTGSLARKTVWIGSHSPEDEPSLSSLLFYEAEIFTALDAATKTAVSGAHGGTAVRHTSISPTWTPLLEMESLSHSGNFRMLARLYASADAEVRVDYSVGDGVVSRQNPSVTVPGSGTTAFHIRDLGEVRIPKAPIGSQAWTGRIYARSESSGVTVGVDKVWFVPMDSLTVVRPRRRSGLWTPPSYLARDSYSGSASGTVESKSLDLGGTWAKSGSGPSWGLDGAGLAYCGSQGVASYYRATASASDVVVGADIAFSLIPSGADIEVGVMARYSGTGSYAAAYIDPNYADTDDGSGAYLRFRIQEGVNPAVVSEGEPFPIAAAREYSIAAQITANGVYRVWAGPAGALPSEPQIVGYHASLATGGSAASGSAGFYSLTTGFSSGITQGTATIDDWYAYAPIEDAAVLAGQELSVRHDGAWRETADSGVYAPAHVEGGYPRDPVAGIEGRLTWTLIVASAGDTEDAPDLDPTSWSVSRHYSPTYLFVPE